VQQHDATFATRLLVMLYIACSMSGCNRVLCVAAGLGNWGGSQGMHSLRTSRYPTSWPSSNRFARSHFDVVMKVWLCMAVRLVAASPDRVACMQVPDRKQAHPARWTPSRSMMTIPARLALAPGRLRGRVLSHRATTIPMARQGPADVDLAQPPLCTPAAPRQFWRCMWRPRLTACRPSARPCKSLVRLRCTRSMRLRKRGVLRAQARSAQSARKGSQR
jgi:hypothetical protein